MRGLWVVLSDRRILSKESWEEKKVKIAKLDEAFQQFKGALTAPMRNGLTHSFHVLPRIIDTLWAAHPKPNLEVS